MSASGTFEVDKNGSVTFEVTTAPAPFKPCPGKHATSIGFEDESVTVLVDGEPVLAS